MISVNELLALLRNVKTYRNYWTALCPAHEDRKNSLKIWQYPDGAIGLHCYAQCARKDVLRAIGLTPADLRPNGSQPAPQARQARQASDPQPVHQQQPAPQPSQPREGGQPDALEWLATYCLLPVEFLKTRPLYAEPGWLVFAFGDGLPVKRRAIGAKEFVWQPAGESVPSLWPLPGAELPEAVWLCEGETDALVMQWLGFEAYAVTKGAGTQLSWHEAEALRSRGVRRVIVAYDADEAGAKGAQALAKALRGAGLSVTVLDLGAAGLVDVLRCEKDWRDMWRASLRQGGDPADIRAGLRALLQSLADAEAEAAAEAENNRQPIGYADILAKELQPQGWIVPELLPLGELAVLAARAKLGKTWLALQLSLSVATGGVFLGKQLEARNVLYLALEDSEFQFQSRLRRLIGDGNANLQGLERAKLLSSFPALNLPEGKEALQALLSEKENKPQLVIIDTLTAARQGRYDENESTDVADLANWLRRLAHNTQATILLVHHHGKASYGDVVSDLRGSSALGGAADVIWGLYRERGAASAKLCITGRSILEAELALSYDAEVTQVWQLVGDAEAVAMRENERAILEALSELGEAGIQDIAEYIGKDRTSVLRTLHTLRAAGHVVMKSEGSKHIYSIKAAEKQ